MYKAEPEELHEWYLEATKLLKKESYNPNAQKPYDELSEEQKFIDKFICDRINNKIGEEEKENWFSFNKISIMHSKKYKNNFDKVEVETFADEKGEDYLVDEEGTVWKQFDELAS